MVMEFSLGVFERSCCISISQPIRRPDMGGSARFRPSRYREALQHSTYDPLIRTLGSFASTNGGPFCHVLQGHKQLPRQSEQYNRFCLNNSTTEYQHAFHALGELTSWLVNAGGGCTSSRMILKVAMQGRNVGACSCSRQAYCLAIDEGTDGNIDRNQRLKL